MPDPDETPPLSPGAFGRALHEFLEVSLALALAEDSELTKRLRDHLGVEHLGDVPIQSRDLILPDHPTCRSASTTSCQAARGIWKSSGCARRRPRCSAPA